MADLTTAQAAATSPVPGHSSNTMTLFGSIDIAVAQSTADIITLFTAPAGFTPLYGFLQGADLDTGTEALEIDIGITGDTTKYLNSGVISGDAVTEIKPVAGIWMPLAEELFTVVPTEFTSDTSIIANITAAANAGGTGVLTCVMVGVYKDPRVAA